MRTFVFAGLLVAAIVLLALADLAAAYFFLNILVIMLV